MPDKGFLTNQPKWGIQNLGESRGEFLYAAKQENDVYDNDLKRYM